MMAERYDEKAGEGNVGNERQSEEGERHICVR